VEFVLSKVKHSGVQGLAITTLKDEIDSALKSTDLSSQELRGGQGLSALLHSVFSPPSANTSKVFLESSDRTMAALNLLLYLTLKLPSLTAQPCFKECVRSADVNYVPWVCAEIDKTRGEAVEGLRATENERGRGSEDSELSVSVEGMMFGDISREEKRSVLHSTLTHLDMMQSVVDRVKECILIKCDTP